ncbi:mannonate dehydratase [Natronoglomus mannanivorans]|uniref:mannonate dehydratase n=1 Tax=Natronoglomus mannanivorans TaxID=2979990 RepID=A0AAP2Z2U8_9EURY|nr:mannonate dehydratase [Halobacteria archaeon AArc-xg1-1]
MASGRTSGTETTGAPTPALFLPPAHTERWDLARQLGVTTAVTGVPRDVDDPWAAANLRRVVDRFARAGIDVAVIEDRPPMDDIMTGGPAQEEQLETVQRLLRSMGEADIPVWCPCWMARHDWARTATSVPSRGRSLVTAFDRADVEDAPPLGDVSRETLWENLEYFVERVIPVAEAADVKLAMHPDDPPLSSLRGVGRILSSREGFDRLLSLSDSEYNGIAFCQGNFAAMGLDVPEAIRYFGDRIHFAHFRDVDGDADEFVETWHDDGPTDMHAAMDAYREVGFDGPIRPDHVPTMGGEDNASPGYETKGRLFAIGYMKGLLERSESVQ